MQPFSRILAIALLATMVAAGAGATCLLSVSAAPARSPGCHPARVPSQPQPGDYRCCVSLHPSALLTSIFTPRPALQPFLADAIDPLVTACESRAFPSEVAPSGGPPGFTTLRI